MSRIGVTMRCKRLLRDMAIPRGTPNRTQMKAHTKMIASVCIAS